MCVGGSRDETNREVWIMENKEEVAGDCGLGINLELFIKHIVPLLQIFNKTANIYQK